MVRVKKTALPERGISDSNYIPGSLFHVTVLNRARGGLTSGNYKTFAPWGGMVSNLNLLMA